MPENYSRGWLENHRIYNTAVTLKVAKEIGYFENVEFLRYIPNYSQAGARDYLYLVDDKWQVTVNSRRYGYSEYFDNYIVEELVDVEAKQKAFGRRVARLSKEADVPWEVGVFAGHLEEDDEVISVLTAVKAAKGTADEKQNMQLTSESGIEQRTAVFVQLLGDTWEKLNCHGQRSIQTLATYLAS